MTIGKSTHEGHRKRLKDKLLKFGPDIFSDHELLEILLFFSIPRANTNDIAHTLLDKFGSLEAVFSASADQLSSVEGVGSSSALLIKTVGAVNDRSRKRSSTKKKRFTSLNEVCEMLSDHFVGLNSEKFIAVYLDASMRLIDVSTIAEGAIGEAAVTPSKVAREAVIKGASGVIIAHNHPLGAASLSSSDRNLTHVIEASLAAVDIALLEHVIVGEVGYAPTMIYRPNTARANLGSRIYGDSFYKDFYKY